MIWSIGRRRSALALGLVLLATAGCGSGDQNALDPASGPARDIATLWWWMFAVALVVFAGAVGLLALGWLHRRRRGLPLFGENERLTASLVVVFGIAIPLVAVVSLFVASDVFVITKTDAPAVGSTALTVEVIGHQWFWEVRYPGSTAVTANEIHIPARTRVDVVLRTADVIHSFWVPRLNRKTDMIPGRTNHLLLEADETGVYRGQCAEFCGLQHAHMGLKIFVEPPERFRAWLASQEQPAAEPTTASARSGRQVFLSEPCASCHAIRGTAADGEVGADLTHLASRTTLASNTIPNTFGDLASWISNPQHVKPGNKMPAVPLGRTQLQDLLAYLQGLR